MIKTGSPGKAPTRERLTEQTENVSKQITNQLQRQT